MCIFNWQGKILFLSLKISRVFVFFSSKRTPRVTLPLQCMIEYISPCTSFIEGEKLSAPELGSQLGKHYKICLRFQRFYF